MITSVRQGLQPRDAMLAAFKDSNRVGVGSVIREASKSCEMSQCVRKIRVEKILEDLPDVLLLTSFGNLDNDISNIRKVRSLLRVCVL
jgi:hypothetical protein